MSFDTKQAETAEPGVEQDTESLVRAWWRIGAALVVAGQSMAFSLAVNMTPPDGAAYWIVHGSLIAAALAVCVLLLPPLAAECWRSLRRGVPSVEALFLITLFGAFVASLIASITRTGAVFYEVVAILLAVYSVGKTLGARSRAKVLRTIERTRTQFDRCLLVGGDGALTDTAVAAVREGARVRVPAGAAICVDGNVVSGRSFVQETAMTGEWRPVSRGPGDAVLAGTHTVDGDLEIEVTASFGRRRLDAVLDEVQRARIAPSRLQEQADRLTAWFLPIVLTVSIGTFAFWMWRDSWVVALFNSMAVLLVACPCALGLATPLAVWRGLERLSRMGLVARTGDVLDSLARADFVCFDKTGTLSESSLRVAAAEFAQEFVGREADVARWILAAEKGDSHPVARALVGWASERAVETATIVSLEREPGRGIRAVVRDGERSVAVAIGNEAMFEVARVLDPRPQVGDLPYVSSHVGLSGEGRAIFVSVDGVPAARLELSERWRTGAAKVFARLRELGVESEILTGDPLPDKGALPGVAWRKGLGPAQKTERVVELRAAGRSVLFLGDGINDAAAMSAADVSIAMAGGAQLAHAAAPAVFLGEDLSFLPEAISCARSVIRSVGTNIRFAAAYNAIGMTIAAAGLLHPVVAALLMVGSSAFVSVRALRSGN
ncbi:MAG TPA: cation-translocating P-type ATPase [Opitutaceae bacterium]|nr:cation-translocating P-type ATPase [Opitutaceae bacterium]